MLTTLTYLLVGIAVATPPRMTDLRAMFGV